MAKLFEAIKNFKIGYFSHNSKNPQPIHFQKLVDDYGPKILIALAVLLQEI